MSAKSRLQELELNLENERAWRKNLVNAVNSLKKRLGLLTKTLGYVISHRDTTPEYSIKKATKK